MNYRREIDGLRAVAVVPVILFHAGIEMFSGGFVGVDVFFVISGYLITTIILADMERGTFSLADFYERRARRILPALFLVMFACLPFAWRWLLPSDMVGFSQSLVAVSTFSSNLYFWQTAGYWGIENELIPLLHTWSLAVEEQYYLLFPLFMMMMWRYGKHWIAGSFILFAIGSLAIAQWGADRYPTATFFLLVTRGWELAIGAGIAAFSLREKTQRATPVFRPWISESLSLGGLLLIAYAIHNFDESVPYPSLYTLIPTVGTALIILFTSQATVTGRLLGMKPLVGIGLISYSAYLWHLPIFAFAKYRSLVTPSVFLFLMLSLLSMVLAYLSWRYFERPFRNKSLFHRKAIFTFAGLGSLFFIVLGLAGHHYDGWPGRMDYGLQASLEAAKLKNVGNELCLRPVPDPGITETSCVLSEGAGKYAVLLGDSHAIAMSGAIKNAFEQTDTGLIQATERGCPPVPRAYVYVSESDRLRCYNHNQAVFSYLDRTPEAEIVILVARWALYAEGHRFDNQEGGVEPYETLYFDVEAADEPGLSASDLSEQFQQAYVDSVSRLLGMGKHVVLVYSVPEAGWHVPRHITSAYLSNAEDAFSLHTGSTSYDVFSDRNAKVYEAFDGIGDHPALFRVYPENIFCRNQLENRCIVQEDRTLLYSDDDHLSRAGAELVAQEIMRHLR